MGDHKDLAAIFGIRSASETGNCNPKLGSYVETKHPCGYGCTRDRWDKGKFHRGNSKQEAYHYITAIWDYTHEGVYLHDHYQAESAESTDSVKKWDDEFKMVGNEPESGELKSDKGRGL